MLKVVSLPAIGGVGNGLMLIIVGLLTGGVTGKQGWKKPGFFKKKTSPVGFLGFGGFFWVFWVFLGFFAQTRGF